ncbi:guanylate cyclase soluble subunit beta-2-like isoform X2 [Acanthaster planci]|uniref:guanylate cyclase n=1 Tax=Acanthaster planci TaxID=133434 RepID=A0A8B7ZS98_ACAPL|nr:guanylate cyclase soluble subunit beta-2-like isoform X2 [Acanthaster planci]
MYGFINLCVRALVLDKFGDEAWHKIRENAGVEDSFITHGCYDDTITLQLVQAASEISGLKVPVILELFGEFFFSFCQKSGYDEMLRALGGNLKSFLENLDSLHSYLSFSYEQMEAPSFRCERRHDNALILHYYSHRKGLHPIVVGIVRAVAKEFFDSELKMEVIDETHEEERNGKKEHVTFAIYQRRIRKIDEGPPKFVAQSRKHSEQQLNKEDETDVQAVFRNIEEHKEAGTKPLNHYSPKKIQSLISLGNLYGSFNPTYPEKLWMTQQVFCEYFPYHLVFDGELMIMQAGVHIQRIMPRLRSLEGNPVCAFFDLIHPQIDWSIRSIQKFENMQFVLQTRRDSMTPEWGRDQPMLQLRGQMVWMESLDAMVYICSPRVASLKELEARNLHLSDIPFHDVTRDLILFNHQRLAEIELGKQLEQKKEELRTALQALETEKQKTDMLLHSMLPRQVADQLREGKKVEAGEYELVTILFSDIVSFTNICSKCRPIDIVNMLNSLYIRFDKLTTVHDVYKVETIGDAYMVVGGLPIPITTHAERVANMALGMMVLSSEVISPVSREPIGIRIGIHSGPAVAGVVGEKMPRYCLFGDTVNTASRMESHGVPNKIHISSSAYSCLSDKAFRFENRGEIVIKGKGLMNTYFLEGNDSATMEEILGTYRGNEADSSRGSTPEKTDKTKTPPDTPSLLVGRYVGVDRFGPKVSDDTKVVPMYYPDNDKNRTPYRTGQRSSTAKSSSGTSASSSSEPTSDDRPKCPVYKELSQAQTKRPVDGEGARSSRSSGATSSPRRMRNRISNHRESKTCTLL